MDISKTSRPHTQAKNATSHPGEIVLQAGGKRCSKAEKAANDKLLRDALVKKEGARKKGIAHLADMEVEMEVTQAVVKKLAPVCPHPQIKSKSAGPTSKEVTSAKDGMTETEVKYCFILVQYQRITD